MRSRGLHRNPSFEGDRHANLTGPEGSCPRTPTFARMRAMFLRAAVPAVAAVLAILVVAPPAAAVPGWSRPVAGPVVRGFEPSATRYGAGHLGVDFKVPPGTPVRSVGAGLVVFAGRVAGALYVVVRHEGGLRTSYAFLATVGVRAGQVVGGGAVLGSTGGRGENHDGGVLHLGLRIGDTYADPMILFAPPDLGAVVHLAPVREPGSSGPVVDGAGDDRALGAGRPGRAGAAAAVAATPSEIVPICYRWAPWAYEPRADTRIGSDRGDVRPLH